MHCQPDASLEQCLRRIRRALRRREKRLIRTLADEWRPTHEWLKASIEGLVTQAQAQGLSPADVYRLARWQAIQEGMEEHLRRYGASIEGDVADAKRMAARTGLEQAEVALKRYGVAEVGVSFVEGAFPDLPADLLTAAMQDGTPLARYFAERYGAEVTDALRSSLTQSLILGWGPRRAARYVAQKAGGLALTRAMTIARTELMRAHREAARWRYMDAGVKRWMRVSSRDSRTCPVCWALDGKTYPVHEMMKTHPNCRCTLVPVLEGLGDDFPPAERAMLELTPAQVRQALGVQRAAAFRMGDATLADFVEWTERPPFGRVPRTRPLARAFSPQHLASLRSLLSEPDGWVQVEKVFYPRLLRRELGELARWTGREAQWNGGIRFFTAEEKRAVTWGLYWPDTRHIGLNLVAADAHEMPDIQRLYVLVHEALHSMSGANATIRTAAEYAEARGLEEGVVEMLARTWMQRRYGTQGIGAYPEYIAELTAIAGRLGTAPDVLAKRLLPMTIAERVEYLNREWERAGLPTPRLRVGMNRLGVRERILRRAASGGVQ